MGGRLNVARFVKVGNSGTMINVEQITAIYPNDESDKYTACMTNGTENYVTYDELLEIIGKRQRQASDKKYAVRVLKGETATIDSRYLQVNYQTNQVAFADKYEIENWRASFTKKEIEELKKRDDIAVDWDKVELEEVYDAE